MLRSIAGRVPPVLRRSLWAVADQAIFALSNFALVFYLSRGMAPEAFGALSFGLSVFFLATAVHTSALVEPMLVFGGNRYSSHLRSYLTRLFLVGNTALSTLVLAAFLAASVILHRLGQPEIGDALIGIGLAAPPSLLCTLVRRSLYLRGLIHVSVVGGALYLATLLAALLALSLTGNLTLTTAALPMGLAGAVSAAFILWYAPLPPEQAGEKTTGEAARTGPRDIGRQHAIYARWAVVSESIHWLASNLPILALPLWHGLGAAATFKVVNLLYMPLYQAISASMSSIIPSLSARRGTSSFAGSARRAKAVFSALALLYALLFSLAEEPLMRAAYGERYDLSLTWLLALSGVALFYSLAHAQFAALRAMERPDTVLAAYVGLCAVLVASLLFYPAYGLDAAFTGLALAWATACVVNAVMLARIAPRPAAGAEVPGTPRDLMRPQGQAGA